MDLSQRDRFTELWARYFTGADLPIVFQYADSPGDAEVPEEGPRCFVGQLSKVRKGCSLAFNMDAVQCFGGKRYLGFSQELKPGFEHFLSCGIPGKMEGERYKKTPELVKAFMERMPVFAAPAPYILFKRWDQLTAADQPEVVIFFAKPDVLSGLFTLTGFDESDMNAVITPFGAGCASIVQFPWNERAREHPRAVLGMFDVSARPCVSKDTLTFAVPMNKLIRMVDNMEESFLITPSWEKVRERL